MSLWDKAWPGPSIRLGQPLGAAPLDSDGLVPRSFLPLDAAMIVTGNYAASPGETVYIDSSDGPVTITVAVAPAAGQRPIILVDPKGTWSLHNVTFDPGSMPIAVPDGADATSLICSDDWSVVVIGTDGVRYLVL